MRKYFTRRCIGLHLLALVLVPSFLVAGWWQYDVARHGNDLSWVYTFEWPFFALYAVYVWWKLIHDKSTPFDRLWAAKQRAAADAAGTPVYQIPGWATDKELSREVHRASIEAARAPALAEGGVSALGPLDERSLLSHDAGVPGAAITAAGLSSQHDPDVIDTRVIDVRVVRNEESEALDAYNRYLFELSRTDPPKRWVSRGRSRGDRHPVGPVPVDEDADAPVRPRPQLPREGAAGGPA
jgi:hypothetical protein